MPHHSSLDTYTTLLELLRVQEEALKENETQKLGALAPQIEAYCQKVSELGEAFFEFSSEQLKTARQRVLQLRQQVESNRDVCKVCEEQLKKQRDLLKSSRRFLHESRLKNASRRFRVSHSA